jgi:hypothetical protein
VVSESRAGATTKRQRREDPFVDRHGVPTAGNAIDGEDPGVAPPVVSRFGA